MSWNQTLHLPPSGESFRAALQGPCGGRVMILCSWAPFRSQCGPALRGQVHQAGGVGNSCRLVAFERVPWDNPDNAHRFEAPMTSLASP
jgi:hypothetical protein